MIFAISIAAAVAIIRAVVVVEGGACISNMIREVEEMIVEGEGEEMIIKITRQEKEGRGRRKRTLCRWPWTVV